MYMYTKYVVWSRVNLVEGGSHYGWGIDCLERWGRRKSPEVPTQVKQMAVIASAARKIISDFQSFCFSLFNLFHQEGHLCFHFSTFVGLSLSLVSSHLTVKPPVTHLPQILIASNSPTTLYCLTLGSKWVGEPDYSSPDTGKLYSGHLVAPQLVSESEQDFSLILPICSCIN